MSAITDALNIPTVQPDLFKKSRQSQFYKSLPTFNGGVIIHCHDLPGMEESYEMLTETNRLRPQDVSIFMSWSRDLVKKDIPHVITETGLILRFFVAGIRKF